MDNLIEISTHILVPKHTKLSLEETTTLLEKLNISVNQLPRILKSDPAIRHMDAEPGEVICIERNSPTAGKANYYRVVVSG